MYLDRASSAVIGRADLGCARTMPTEHKSRSVSLVLKWLQSLEIGIHSIPLARGSVAEPWCAANECITSSTWMEYCIAPSTFTQLGDCYEP